MRMRVQFENGGRAEAVLLAGSRREMRVVVEGSTDTEQWEKLDGAWRDENGGPIEIEALIAVDGTDWLAFCAEAGGLTVARGAS